MGTCSCKYHVFHLFWSAASDIPDALVDEVLREVASDAKIPHLAPYMRQKSIITDDEYQQLTSPRTGDLQRENFTKILMKRNIQWLLEFCHCLLESYESERGLDIHHKLFQQIKGEGMFTFSVCVSPIVLTFSAVRIFT